MSHKNTIQRDFKRKSQLGIDNTSYYTGVNRFHSLPFNYIVHFTNGSVPGGPPGNHLAHIIWP